MASYKHSYHLYSEFISVADAASGSAVPTPIHPPQQQQEEEGGLSAAGTAGSTGTAAAASAFPAAAPSRGPPPEDLRFYTPRECARLMGFPETFRVGESTNKNHWYHQCGNAVCPLEFGVSLVAVLSVSLLSLV